MDKNFGLTSSDSFKLVVASESTKEDFRFVDGKSEAIEIICRKYNSSYIYDKKKPDVSNYFKLFPTDLFNLQLCIIIFRG